jgi:hypothetical protein
MSPARRFRSQMSPSRAGSTRTCLTGPPQTGRLPDGQRCEYDTCVFDHKGKPYYSNPAWGEELPHLVSDKQNDRLVTRRQAIAKFRGIPCV